MKPKNLGNEIVILFPDRRSLPIITDLELKLYFQFNSEINPELIGVVYSIQCDITDE